MQSTTCPQTLQETAGATDADREHRIDVEHTVTAFLVFVPPFAGAYAAKIDPSLFVSSDCGTIARVAIEQHTEHGVVDPATVCDVAALRLDGMHVASGRTASMRGWIQEWMSKHAPALLTLGADSAHVAAQSLIERGRRDRIERVLGDIDDRMDTAELLAALRDLVDRESRADTPLARVVDFRDPSEHEDDLRVRTDLAWWDCEQPAGDGLIGGSLIGIAGPPGAGKSTLAGQIGASALLHDPTLRVLWAHAEMTPHDVHDRMLAGLARLAISVLRRREPSPEQARRKAAAVADMRSLTPRLAFLSDSLTPRRIVEAARQHRAGLVVVDYLQLVGADTVTAVATRRDVIDNTVANLVDFARAEGVTMLLISSMPNVADPETVGVAGAFKESGGIAYALDAAYIGCPGEPVPAGVPVVWRNVKQRRGEMRDVRTWFVPAEYRFEEWT